MSYSFGFILLRPRIHMDFDGLNLLEDICIHRYRQINIENAVRDDQELPVPQVSPQDIRRFETFAGQDKTERGTPGVAALIDNSLLITAIAVLSLKGIRSGMDLIACPVFKSQGERHCVV